MEIKMLQLLEGAGRAEGLTVIIDVFRAFSLECCLYAWGAGSVTAVGSLGEAYRRKQECPECILIGERKGKKCEGFDYGNSPSQVKGADLRGKRVIHTTSAGTQGLAAAAGADEIIAGSLLGAKAAAEYIRRRNPGVVSLVAMGNGGVREAKEDILCAEYIRSLLTGQDIGIDKRIAGLRQDGGEHFFVKETQEVFPEEDFYMCIENDRFPFVLKAEPDGRGGFCMVKTLP